MYILGISAYYHDSAACIIKEYVIVAAAQEERFTRKKHDKSFPSNAIKYCINNKISGIYNIGTNISLSLEEILEEFNQIESNKPDPVIKSFFEKAKKFWRRS